eukprot:Colp12_sorted_trinity150504_noHs@31241
MASVVRTLLVGLGNPGPSYSNTRHNIGMKVLNAVADRSGVSWTKNRDCQGATAIVSSGTLGSTHGEIILLKPALFMNESGKSIARAVKFFKITNFSDIIVVHDDLEREFGKLSVKLSGSANGHNGVRSTIECLKTDKFRRLRVGISRPANSHDVANYVLRPFSSDEGSQMPQVLDASVDMLVKLCSPEPEPVKKEKKKKEKKKGVKQEVGDGMTSLVESSVKSSGESSDKSSEESLEKSSVASSVKSSTVESSVKSSGEPRAEGLGA